MLLLCVCLVKNIDGLILKIGTTFGIEKSHLFGLTSISLSLNAKVDNSLKSLPHLPMVKRLAGQFLAHLQIVKRLTGQFWGMCSRFIFMEFAPIPFLVKMNFSETWKEHFLF